MGGVLKWLPRLIGVGAVLFIASFALDMFSEPGGPDPLGLFIHLIPALVLALLVAIAWRYPVVGGVLLLVLSAAPFVFLSNTLAVNAMLAAPAALAGLLFILDGLRRRTTAAP